MSSVTYVLAVVLDRGARAEEVAGALRVAAVQAGEQIQQTGLLQPTVTQDLSETGDWLCSMQGVTLTSVQTK